MATKIIVRTIIASDVPSPVKAAAEPPVKLESDEELRRRRAGIACFL